MCRGGLCRGAAENKIFSRAPAVCLHPSVPQDVYVTDCDPFTLFPYGNILLVSVCLSLLQSFIPQHF